LSSRIQRHGSRVHLVLRAGSIQKPRGDLVAQTTGAEMNHNPNSLLLVLQNVHVVVPTSDCTKLSASHIPQRCEFPCCGVGPLGNLPSVVVLEKFVVNVLAILAPDPEADR